MMAAGTVEVRMYNVGFGDAFRVTVRRGDETWRMLVDCGVHSHGAARPLAESVQNIISDLAEDCGGTPHLDVVVATHHHRDHILGFAADDWAAVEVDEVWVPFVEDGTDADARNLRTAQTRTADKLAALIGERQQRLAASQTEAMQKLAIAMSMARNSRGNAKATDRLLGRNETTFAKAKHEVRFLPDKNPSKNTIRPSKCGVVGAHPRPAPGPEHAAEDGSAEDRGLADTEPGRRRRRYGADRWRRVHGHRRRDLPLFNRAFVIEDRAQVPESCSRRRTSSG